MHKISKNMSTKNLFRFIVPSIVTMIFLSFYTMVDGIFVSKFINEDALAAVNISYPFVSLAFAIGVMLATGGNAIVAKNLGEGKHEEAKQHLSLIFTIGISVGLSSTILGFIFIDNIIKILGTSEKLYNYTYDYLSILIIASPFGILQCFSQVFLVTTGKPKLALYSIISAGVANIILDYIFIVHLNMGIAGAALATAIGYSIAGSISVFYFFFNKEKVLNFVKFKWDSQMLLQTCTNGSSELVSNLAYGIVTMSFNRIMLHLAGEQGVAAITVLLYTQFLLGSIYFGFTLGISPLFSYTYGNNNKIQTKKLFKFSTIFIIVSSIIIYAASLLLADTLIGFFLHRSSASFALAKNGFYIFSTSFLFVGPNIFASGLFTAFSNGLVSAVISFMRTLVFIIGSLLILPNIIGINGVWLAIPLAEILSITISLFYIKKYRSTYHY